MTVEREHGNSLKGKKILIEFIMVSSFLNLTKWNKQFFFGIAYSYQEKNQQIRFSNSEAALHTPKITQPFAFLKASRF